MTAFEILTKKHDYIQKNGEKPSEYNEDKIIEAMEEYAQQQVKNLNIPAVMQRSELLFAFAQYLGVDCGVVIYDTAKKIDDFLSKQ
jgi:hypothetical protein